MGRCSRCSKWMEKCSCFLSILAMYPTAPSESKMDKKESSVEEMRSVIQHARRALAFKLWDFFDSIDKLEEKEFLDVISELDGDGVKISQMIEKFRRYKGV